MAKQINTRIINKHDTQANWAKATGFIPEKGEILVVDDLTPPGIMVGDGTTPASELPMSTLMIDENGMLSSERVLHKDAILFDILETYIYTIDYDSLLAFDISEIVIGATPTSSVLGQAILGQLVLA